MCVFVCICMCVSYVIYNKVEGSSLNVVMVFPLQEFTGRFRGVGTFKWFSTAGTAPVGTLSGPFTGAK